MGKAKAVRRVPVKLQADVDICGEDASVLLVEYRACPCLRHLARGKRSGRRRMERRGKEDGKATALGLDGEAVTVNRGGTTLNFDG